MLGQMNIFQIETPEKPSICFNCYYECKGKCCGYHSKYQDMSIPQNGCEWFDGVSVELLEKR